MNNWYGIGRLTRDPELRYTATNKAVCNFVLAISRPKIQDRDTETDFINFQVWGKSAENLNKYQRKGNQLAVSGSLRVDTFEDKEGKRGYKTYVLVDRIQYLSLKQEEVVSNTTTTLEENKKEKLSDDPFTEFGQQITIDDSQLPF